MKNYGQRLLKEIALAAYEACGANKGKTVFLAIVLVSMYSAVKNFPAAVEKVEKDQRSYNQFVELVNQDRIKSVQISEGGFLVGTLKDGASFSTILPEEHIEIVDKLLEEDVEIKFDRSKPTTFREWLLAMIILAIPLTGLKFAYDLFKAAQANFQNRKKSPAHEIKPVTFEDIAGVDEALRDLQEIVDYFRDPTKFERLGARAPKGVLLVGPPGTGKTLLARAVAGEAGVSFFDYSGSDFFKPFAGQGATFVRNVFETARQNRPCIIFIDEIDAIGTARSSSQDSGSAADDRAATLNQLLTGIDGFGGSDGIILLAATNRPDVLDPAITRPGRIDRRIEVPNPDVNGREAILRVHTRNIPLDDDVDLALIARGISGFSGAAIANLVNEAALLALRGQRDTVSMADFENAKDKIIMGGERSMAMTDHEKRITAYHEAGHALISLLVPGLDPLHKVTIVPRGQALGLTVSMPEHDRYSMTKAELEGHLNLLFGGRIAEELIFGAENITTGASSDIERATRIARSMVTQYGFSDLGPINFDGHTGDGSRFLSEHTAEQIDHEVGKIIKAAQDKTRALLSNNRTALDAIAEGLLDKETLTGDEVRQMMPPGIVGRRELPAHKL